MSDLSLINKIWPGLKDYQFFPQHYARFLHYIESSCACVAAANAPFVTKTLSDTLDLIDVVRNANLDGPPAKQLTEKVRETLLQNQVQNLRPLSSDNVTNTISLTLKLLLSLETREWPRKWGDRSSIAAIIESELPSKSMNALPPNTAPLDPRLTMEYLCGFHGFRVLFTDSLAKHLEIHWQGSRSQKPVILIYKHKVFLWNELRFPQRSLLPKDFVEETLDTINLLFPSHDYHTSSLLDSYKMKDFYEIGPCERPRRRDVQNYSYWRGRILELSEVVQSPAVGFQQLRPDRDGRNLMSFLNFWVAMLVAIFTIVSIAFGAASIALAKFSYDLSDKQYRLSLAQACAAPNAMEEFPEYC